MKIEELIETTASFIPELYKTLKLQIAIKRGSKENDAPIISHIRDMEIAVDFILVDLGVSIKAVAQTKGPYEGRFHTKNMLAVLSEGYKLVYGFGNRRKKSIWRCLKKDIVKYSNDEFISRYNNITTLLNNFGDSHLDPDLRNLTLHYDDNMMNVYKKTVSIYNIDDSCHSAIAFFDILKKMMEIGNDIYKDLGIEQILYDNKAVLYLTYPLDNDRLHSIFKNVIDREGKLESILRNFLSASAGKSLDVAAGTAKSIEAINNKAKELKLGNNIPEIKNLYVLNNLQMLIQFMELDLACVLDAWFNSNSEVEGVMTLRRITIIKVAVLSHLIGYEQDEKQKSIWSSILKFIPYEDNTLVSKAKQIEEDLYKLVDSKNDRDERNVYVHYVVGSKQTKLTSIAESIEHLNFFKIMRDLEMMVLLYSKLKSFLNQLMDSLGEKARNERIKSTNSLLAQNNKIRELVQSTKMDEEQKNNFLKQIDRMDEFIKDPLKGL